MHRSPCACYASRNSSWRTLILVRLTSPQLLLHILFYGSRHTLFASIKASILITLLHYMAIWRVHIHALVFDRATCSVSVIQMFVAVRLTFSIARHGPYYTGKNGLTFFATMEHYGVMQSSYATYYHSAQTMLSYKALSQNEVLRLQCRIVGIPLLRSSPECQQTRMGSSVSGSGMKPIRCEIISP